MTNGILLLVEDDGNDAILFKHIFRQLNKPPRLEVVTNGEEAISYLKGQDRFSDRPLYPFPSMVLLDEKLPGKSGTEVLDWIKSAPIASPLFVTMLTGESQASAPLKILERFGKVSVFNCHFLKPATLNSVETLFSFYKAWYRRQARETMYGATELIVQDEHSMTSKEF